MSNNESSRSAGIVMLDTKDVKSIADLMAQHGSAPNSPSSTHQKKARKKSKPPRNMHSQSFDTAKRNKKHTQNLQITRVDTGRVNSVADLLIPEQKAYKPESKRKGHHKKNSSLMKMGLKGNATWKNYGKNVHRRSIDSVMLINRPQTPDPGIVMLDTNTMKSIAELSEHSSPPGSPLKKHRSPSTINRLRGQSPSPGHGTRERANTRGRSPKPGKKGPRESPHLPRRKLDRNTSDSSKSESRGRSLTNIMRKKPKNHSDKEKPRKPHKPEDIAWIQSEAQYFFSSCKTGDTQKVSTFLRKGWGVDIADQNGYTPLVYACHGKHLDIVEVLLHYHANVDHITKTGDTPLSAAVAEGYIDLVEMLLDNQADVNISANGYTPIIFGTYEGHTDVVDLLLSRNAIITMASKEGYYPLNIAAMRGHFDIAEKFLAHDPDIDVNVETESIGSDRGGETPLHLASMRGHKEVVKLLLGYKADPCIHNVNKFYPITSAASGGYTEIIKLLLESDASVHSVDKVEWTPLVFAAQDGHSDSAELLLVNGANVNHATTDGWTALLAASKNGCKNVVGVLLEHEADINQVHNELHTGLMEAALDGHLDVVKLLVGEQADIDLTTKSGNRAVDLAQAQCHAHIRNYLRYKAGDFHMLYSNDDLKEVTMLSSKEYEDMYRARVCVPGLSLNVVVKLPAAWWYEEEELSQLHEYDILRALPPHPNLLAFLGVCLNFQYSKYTETKACVVVPYFQAGILKEYIRERDKSLPELLRLCLDTVCVLEHVVVNGFYFSQVTLESFCVSILELRKHAILCDMRYIRKNKEVPEVKSGPEVPSPKNYEEHQVIRADRRMRRASSFGILAKRLEVGDDMQIFTIGILLWEMLSDRDPPFMGTDGPIFSDDSFTPHELIKENFPEELSKLVDRCCSGNVVKQPKIQEIRHTLTLLSEEVSLNGPIAESVDEEEKEDSDQVDGETQAENGTKPHGDEPVSELAGEEIAKVLIAKVRDGSLEAIEALVSEGIDVNVMTRTRWTALMEAVCQNNLEVTKYLVDQNADVNHTDQFNYSPLVLAGKDRRLEVFTYLIEQKADMHSTIYPNSACLWRAAISDSSLEMVDRLVGNHISPYFVHLGFSSLEATHPTIKRYFQRKESKEGKFGEFQSKASILIHSTSCGYFDIVKLLIAHGVDPSWRDSLGKKASEYADENGHTEIGKYLRCLPGPPLAVDFYSQSDLMFLARLSKDHSGFRGGPTFTGQLKTDTGMVTVKIKTPDPKYSFDAWNEIQVLKHIPEHLFILTPIGLCMDFKIEDDSQPGVIIPVPEGGTLHAYLRSQSRNLPTKQILKFALNIAECVRHLHEHNFLHRNIATRNFFLALSDMYSPDQHLVMANFEMCRRLEKATHQVEKDDRLPWRWCAPETLSKGIFSFQSDMYMLGVTLFELLAPTTTPFASEETPAQKLNVLRTSQKHGEFVPLQFPAGGSEGREGIKSTIRECCNYEAEERPHIVPTIARLKNMYEACEDDDDEETSITERSRGPSRGLSREPSISLSTQSTQSNSMHYLAVPSGKNDEDFAKEYVGITTMNEDIRKHDDSKRSVSEKIDLGVAAKERADELFNAKRFVDAANEYEAALIVLEELDYETNFEMTKEQSREALALKLACYIDLASCQFKSGHYQDVITNCSKALRIDRQNVRALYRRAKAYDQTDCIQFAISDLRQALQGDPTNEALRGELKRLIKHKEKRRERS